MKSIYKTESDLQTEKKKEVWSPKGRGEKQIRSMGLTDIKYHM